MSRLALSFLMAFNVVTCYPIDQQYPTSMESSQYPAQQQETKQQPPSPYTAHHGYMYGPQPTQPQYVAPLPQAAHIQVPESPKPQQVMLNDPDFQMLARSLNTGTGSVGLNQPIAPREMMPCSTDGRSVTIDHLRISPESLVQIARLAQAFGTSPDWKQLRLADMKSALSTQMNPTNQYAARSIGL